MENEPLIAEKETCEPKFDPCLSQLAEDVKSAALEEPVIPTKRDIMTMPLFELSSVRIRMDTKDFDDTGAVVDIYGHIKLTNDFGKKFRLFDRGFADAERVFMSDNLYAILNKSVLNCPRWLPQFFVLELYLVDKKRNNTIIDEKFLLDFSRKVVYDEEQVLTSKGNGRVTVHYTIFRSAVLALVRFMAYKNEENGSGNGESDISCDVVVSGTISASTKSRGQKELTRVLYDKQSDALNFDDFSWLPALAVPTYSLLRIEADFTVNGERIMSGDDALEFELGESGVVYKKEIVGQNWVFVVCVSWKNAHTLFKKNEFRVLVEKDDFEEVLPESEESSESEESGEDDDMSGDDIEESREKRIELPIYRSRGLVEVFSISVGFLGDDVDALRLHGTIEYSDSHNRYFIFKRDEAEPEMVYPQKTVALSEPPDSCHEAEGACFRMDFDLKDDRGREISKGHLAWSGLGAFYWCDMRTCSVILGEGGFAFVHYAIFNFAKATKVRVRLSSLDNVYDTYRVYGTIRARYSSHRYLNHYEKKYYQSKLFEKEKSEFVEISGVESEVPLLKYMVAVPSHACLILEADLRVLVAGAYDTTLKGKVKFDPNRRSMKCLRTIEGQKYNLQLEVQWSS